MNITAITGAQGQLVAIVHAHLSAHDKARPATGPHATLKAMPGQKFHELVAPGHLEGKPHPELRSWVMNHLSIKDA